ncbi:MAG: phosphatidate cytidylyltransferase [Proteobacteria bacterium]|nr:MAG: phosphatidate cytidylyltransferase [Pseudomonadota bacterium]
MRELQRAFKSSGDYGRAPIVGEVAYPATVYAVCFGFSALWAISIVVALGILAVLFGGREGANGPRLSLASLCTTLLCTFYVSLFALFPPLRSLNGGKWFWLVLLLVWTGDTLAYYGGKRFGKHLLSPLSPKKTREGFFIGLFATTLAAPLLASLFNLPIERALIMGAVVGIAAPVGDLLESYFKRELGVKDLGSLLPGHGGVLDRCDSLLFAAFAALVVLGAS